MSSTLYHLLAVACAPCVLPASPCAIRSLFRRGILPSGFAAKLPAAIIVLVVYCLKGLPSAAFPMPTYHPGFGGLCCLAAPVAQKHPTEHRDGYGLHMLLLVWSDHSAGRTMWPDPNGPRRVLSSYSHLVRIRFCPFSVLVGEHLDDILGDNIGDDLVQRALRPPAWQWRERCGG